MFNIKVKDVVYMWEWCFNGIGRAGIFGWMGGIFMMLWPILFLVAIFYFFSKNDQNRSLSTKASDTPLETLKNRYARGEISKEEFEEIKKNLY